MKYFISKIFLYTVRLVYLDTYFILFNSNRNEGIKKIINQQTLSCIQFLKFSKVNVDLCPIGP